jgi:molybdopterin-guanine dinucleotide biosynthesis protein A
MQITILTGGLAAKPGEITKNQPKSMLKIQGRSFVEYKIKLLRKHNSGRLSSEIPLRNINAKNISKKDLQNECVTSLEALAIN